MFWKKKKAEPTYSLADMMRDIAYEKIEANKLDLDLQYYLDQVRERANEGKFELTINPFNLKPGQRDQLKSSLKRLGFGVEDTYYDINVSWQRN